MNNPISALEPEAPASGPTSEPPALVRGFNGFHAAARSIFSTLGRQTGLPSWVLIRRTRNSGVILACRDPLFDQSPSLAFEWDNTIVSRTLVGTVPQVIPDVAAEAGLDDVRLLKAIPIAAHMSVPLLLEDEQGCLIGLDIEPHGPELACQLPSVMAAAAMLATFWNYEVRLAHAMRRAEHAEAESMSDGMTGAYNRRGWRYLLRREEARCKATEGVAGIIVLDLNYLKSTNDSHGHAAGDQLITRTVQTIREVIRADDSLARLGGDEFAVLLPGLAATELAHACSRIADALADAGVSACFGYSWRGEGRTLRECMQEADAILIRTKALRSPRRGEPAPAGA